MPNKPDPRLGKEYEPINLKKEVARALKYTYDNTAAFRNVKQEGFQSSFFDPYSVAENNYAGLQTADGSYNREIDCKTLRRVSKKAWVINLCIDNVQTKIQPFLKPSTNRNIHGFVIHKRGEDVIKAAGKKSKKRSEIEDFLMNTGDSYDPDRDNFQRFCLKIIRDLLEIDQVATEIGFTRAGKPYAFWAVDGATIEKVLPGQNNPDNIKYIQVIDGIAQAFYPEGTLLFDYQNPRTDIYHSYYGYSCVEQAIDLITSQINTFNYNSGFFTDNKLPRGMLLLNGGESQETIEELENYITNIMSGGAQNQWRVPIIPSSSQKEGSSVQWVNLNGTNREMEFQTWLDFLISGIVALFGCSMDELGLQTAKSQPLFEHNAAPEIEAAKSKILGKTLTFLQQYINRILRLVYPDYEMEFVGYERDDPKAIMDITKMELETYKTLNEVRKEKGYPPLDAKFADKCPANPQFVQMYQSEAMQDQGGGMEDVEEGEDVDFGDEGADFGEGEEGNENEGDFGESEESEGGDFGQEDEISQEEENSAFGGNEEGSNTENESESNEENENENAESAENENTESAENEKEEGDFGSDEESTGESEEGDFGQENKESENEGDFGSSEEEKEEGDFGQESENGATGDFGQEGGEITQEEEENAPKGREEPSEGKNKGEVSKSLGRIKKNAKSFKLRRKK